MEKVIEHSFGHSSICRICLEKTYNAVNLFSETETAKNILEKIYLCFQIFFNDEEYLPNSICCKCIEELDCANRFRLKCVTFEDRFNDFNFKVNGINLEEQFELSEDDKRGDVNNAEKEPKCTSDLMENNLGKQIDKQVTNPSQCNNKYNCYICNKLLNSRVSLSKHIVSMHQKRKHIGRMTGHGTNKQYHCIKCTYSTAYSQTLVNHMRRHNGERPFHCQCGKSFTQSASLTTHQKIHSNTKPFICSACGKQFLHAFSLKKHMQVHEIGQYSCDICQKILKTVHSLNAHMNRHYDVRNYSCEDCGNTFVTSTDLMNHRKKHTTEKKAECHLCDYKTRAKKNLMLHLKRHAGEKKFECDKCGKALYTQSDLRRHQRVHSHEKPYPCPACAQHFSQPSSLNQHVRNVHGISDYHWSRNKTTKTVVKENNL